MACNIISHLPDQCAPGQGGISRFLIATHTSSVAVTETNGLISAITPSGSFYTYYCLENSSNITPVATIDRSLNVRNFKDTITMRFADTTVNVRNALEVLSKTKVWIIPEFNDGTYRLYGQYNGCICTGMAGSAGPSADDGHYVEISFEMREPEPAPFVSGSLIAGLIHA